jgi:hypothetical protein
MQADCFGVWTIRCPAITTVSGTARLGVQYLASATNIAEVLSIYVGQTGSNTAAMDSFSLALLSAAATVTAGVTTAGSATVVDWSNGSGPALRGTLSTSGTGTVATTAGTISYLPMTRAFNVLSGYEWNAQPFERYACPINGIMGVLLNAITANTFYVEMTIREILV